MPTATLFPEPDVAEYLGAALTGGARAVKMHVQVGGFDPRDPLLHPAWGLLAEAGVPAIVHCGHGPVPGEHTGLDVFGEVLAAHPRLPVVLAHAGMPDFAGALDLVQRYDQVYLDTTMVGTAFTEKFAPLPPDWAARLVDVADRVVLGTDFPNIPYAYAEQVAAVAGWAAADERLGWRSSGRRSTMPRPRSWPPGGNRDEDRSAARYPVQVPAWAPEGVNGFDSGRRSR